MRRFICQEHDVLFKEFYTFYREKFKHEMVPKCCFLPSLTLYFPFFPVMFQAAALKQRLFCFDIKLNTIRNAKLVFFVWFGHLAIFPTFCR